ncbi:hypothetical protein QYE76_017522 [Lolium multiflorum]|uniref:Uncharacterized protein n=1 Tax=Lolium multiflorum TaxID=4521 RepID=A0AAD8QEE1_LOLMU|nr:hypothetical protein QYE76_017522 [Lolium multiflorum]
MGGLKAASPSPAVAMAMACVVASEVATVLAVMRRNVRWAGVRYGGDDGGGGGADDEYLDHPLIAGLKSLRRRAASCGTRCPAGDPLLYLRPFLDVVRSDETGAPITGAALSSLHKILSLDLVAPSPGVADAMGAVVDAVTGCRFEVTDPASEEAVLARVLQVLLACVRGRAALALANRHVCAIVSTFFRVVQQASTKEELLQRVSRQTIGLAGCVEHHTDVAGHVLLTNPRTSPAAGRSPQALVVVGEGGGGRERRPFERREGADGEVADFRQPWRAARRR